MLVDLSTAVGGYLHQIFIQSFDGWVALGFAGQIFFTARFLVQWIASERAGRSVVPLAFWFFSIGGGLLLFIYAVYRRDPVFILGQGLGLFIYVRNLMLISREKRRLVAAGEDKTDV
ncbi:MAG: lipid-A-disaccharide synthase N-terminal domain-containing protein [Hyphomicrobiales bacterium]|nr:lipid-A-disaccharide synthase N-terminal domain-containing protein [Hyphomicrobiales bacterium]